MKKAVTVALAVAMVVTLSVGVAVAGSGNCTTIQDGTLLASTGEPLVLGYDQFGYNYQAHLFNGRYCDYDRVLGGEYCDVQLVMKWNDAWLSNKDCDGDKKLDRHFGYESYIGSGAWCTNYQSGTYEMDGKKCKWTWWIKIVAVPEDAYVESDYWYTADGTEIGQVIWGQFAIIESVYNDPCAGCQGIEYLSPARAGLGEWQLRTVTLTKQRERGRVQTLPPAIQAILTPGSCDTCVHAQNLPGDIVCLFGSQADTVVVVQASDDRYSGTALGKTEGHNYTYKLFG